ncbi:MAG TPA: hypothetical protein DD729_04885, partial [Rhodobacteraceae bacterium]|nr:hypothetical protein [Paracoccaceae bacterium]
MSDIKEQYEINDGDIAIVGMAAHLPGSGTIDEYWNNLQAGVESIRVLSDEELKD